MPLVVGVAAGGAALLMERVSGTGDLTGVDDHDRAETMASFVDAVAALHNLDVDTLTLDGFAPDRATPATRRGRPRDVGEARRRRRAGPRSARALCRRGCAHPPADADRTVLVQGDTGPGNFVFENGTVTGIVDWEFAHLGDPMDDWAWLDMRMRDADLSALQERYSRATGIEMDPDRIRYYRAAVDYRCAVTTSLAVSRGGGARAGAPYLLVTERYVLELADRMAELLGVVEPATVPTVTPTARTALYDHLLDGVRAATRGVDDVELRESTSATCRSWCTTSARTTRSAPRSKPSTEPIAWRHSAPRRSPTRTSPRWSSRPAPTATRTPSATCTGAPNANRPLGHPARTPPPLTSVDPDTNLRQLPGLYPVR